MYSVTSTQKVHPALQKARDWFMRLAVAYPRLLADGMDLAY